MSTLWSDKEKAPLYTVVLTAGALLPLLVAIGLAYGAIGTDTEYGRKVACHYGAIILGFVGGIHWGFAMIGYGALTGDDREAVYGAAIATFAVAAAGLALYLPTTPGLYTLAAAFIIHLAYDIYAGSQGLSPRWQTNLRIWFVVGVVLSLIACAVVPPA